MAGVHHQGCLFGCREGAQNSILGEEECWALELLKHELDSLLPALQHAVMKSLLVIYLRPA